VQQQPVVPDTGGEQHQQAGLHVAAAASLEAQVVLLPDDRQGEEKGIPFPGRWGGGRRGS
jgi:hypothetical protein